MSEPLPIQEEFCPECGEFVIELNERTGFCLTCSPAPSSHKSKTPQPSRTERWLIKNADTIEHEMVKQRLPASDAIVYVLRKYKATCIICGNPIHRGTPGRHFICSTTPQCKKARRRYKYLIYDKGFTKDAAIKEILSTGETPHGD